MEQLYIIKIGGNIIDDEAPLQKFLKAFAGIKRRKILVHGGGKLATDLASDLNVPQKMVEGRRITGAESLKIVTMVYAGSINKTIVAGLQANACNALGLCGADANLIRAEKRKAGTIDYGFVGDINESSVNAAAVNALLQIVDTLVIAPITHNGEGQLLNTNADTIASEIAKSMINYFDTELVFCFDKKGLLYDVEDENSVISEVNSKNVQSMKDQSVIHTGMLPKIDNALAAVQHGVKKVLMGHAGDLELLISGRAGTKIIN